jgi:hypothetical protein
METCVFCCGASQSTAERSGHFEDGGGGLRNVDDRSRLCRSNYVASLYVTKSSIECMVGL